MITKKDLKELLPKKVKQKSKLSLTKVKKWTQKMVLKNKKVNKK